MLRLDKRRTREVIESAGDVDPRLRARVTSLILRGKLAKADEEKVVRLVVDCQEAHHKLTQMLDSNKIEIAGLVAVCQRAYHSLARMLDSIEDSLLKKNKECSREAG